MQGPLTRSISDSIADTALVSSLINHTNETDVIKPVSGMNKPIFGINNSISCMVMVSG